MPVIDIMKCLETEKTYIHQVFHNLGVKAKVLFESRTTEGFSKFGTTTCTWLKYLPLEEQQDTEGNLFYRSRMASDFASRPDIFHLLS